MINRHIKASESFVIHELEKIARNTGLIKEDPIIEKTASLEEEEEDDVVMLEDSGDLIADVAVLASELRDRGFIKQAERLEEKAFILKRAMSDGGHKSLYEFWKETGEAVVNFAHKTDDADVAGYKPKNLNEVRKSVLQNLNQAPTGKDKAVKMAQKVGYLLKKMADDSKEVSLESKSETSSSSSGGAWIKKLTDEKWRTIYDAAYKKEEQSKNINLLMSLGYIDNNGNPTGLIPEATKEAVTALSFLGDNLNNIGTIIENLGGGAAVFIPIIINNDAKAAKAHLQSMWPSSWNSGDQYFASLWRLTATQEDERKGLDDWGEWWSSQTIRGGSPLSVKMIVDKNADNDAWTLSGPVNKEAQNSLGLLFAGDKLKEIIVNYINQYTADAPAFYQLVEYYLKITDAAGQAAEAMRKAYILLEDNDPNKAIIGSNYKELRGISKISREQVVSFRDTLEVKNPIYGGTTQEAVDAIISGKLKAEELKKNIEASKIQK